MKRDYRPRRDRRVIAPRSIRDAVPGNAFVFNFVNDSGVVMIGQIVVPTVWVDGPGTPALYDFLLPASVQEFDRFRWRVLDGATGVEVIPDSVISQVSGNIELAGNYVGFNSGTVWYDGRDPAVNAAYGWSVAASSAGFVAI
jgi:hypothetical protein